MGKVGDVIRNVRASTWKAHNNSCRRALSQIIYSVKPALDNIWWTYIGHCLFLNRSWKISGAQLPFRPWTSKPPSAILPRLTGA